jgi:hypothetical protein
MRYAEMVGLWVVYQTPVKGRPDGLAAVCGQREWDEMTAARPGYFTLIRDGIANESEAERLARGTAGDRPAPGANKSKP